MFYKNQYLFTNLSKQWLRNQNNDHYVKLSQRLNYRSRAAFKLIQLNDKYHLLKGNVLDLGSAPGSWSQVASNLGCKVTAIDLLEMKPIKNVTFIQGNVKDHKLREYLIQQQWDTIISDMASNFTGNHEDDHLAIIELNQLVIQIAQQSLKKGGNIVMKTLHGSQEKENFDKMRKLFKEFKRDKPLSSRSQSTEIFYVGLGFMN